jgi:hypothetical protein
MHTIMARFCAHHQARRVKRFREEWRFRDGELAVNRLFLSAEIFGFDFARLMRRIRNNFDLQREKGGKKSP